MKRYESLDTKAEKVLRLDNTHALRDSSARTGMSICAACGLNQECSLPQPPDGSALRECIHFQYPIVFMKATGLDAEHFNTMRLGSSWKNRVRAGDVISLVLKKRGKQEGLYKLCSAAVTHVLHADRDFAIAHCSSNHMLIEGEWAGRSREDQVQEMRRILSESYGKNISARYTDATIIYLKPISQ